MSRRTSATPSLDRPAGSNPMPDNAECSIFWAAISACRSWVEPFARDTAGPAPGRRPHPECPRQTVPPGHRDSFATGQTKNVDAPRRRVSSTGFDGDHQAWRNIDGGTEEVPGGTAGAVDPDDVGRPAGAGVASSACRRIGEQLGINPETLRGWVTQA